MYLFQSHTSRLSRIDCAAAGVIANANSREPLTLTLRWCVRFASVLQEGDLIAGPSDLSAPPLSDESENVLATSGIDRVNYI
jgi:hypothetical protein